MKVNSPNPVEQYPTVSRQADYFPHPNSALSALVEVLQHNDVKWSVVVCGEETVFFSHFSHSPTHRALAKVGAACPELLKQSTEQLFADL